MRVIFYGVGFINILDIYFLLMEYIGFEICILCESMCMIKLMNGNVFV